MTTTGLDRRPAPQVSQTDEESVRRRILELLRTEVDFIPNAEFRTCVEGDHEIVDAALRRAEETAKAPADLPAHLRRMCEADLLTHEEESALFREMNFVKFKANALRSLWNAPVFRPGVMRVEVG